MLSGPEIEIKSSYLIYPLSLHWKKKNPRFFYLVLQYFYKCCKQTINLTECKVVAGCLYTLSITKKKITLLLVLHLVNGVSNICNLRWSFGKSCHRRSNYMYMYVYISNCARLGFFFFLVFLTQTKLNHF